MYNICIKNYEQYISYNYRYYNKKVFYEKFVNLRWLCFYISDLGSYVPVTDLSSILFAVFSSCCKIKAPLNKKSIEYEIKTQQ